MNPDATLAEVMQLMAECGFPIKDNVSIKVDPKLSFMGYTAPRADGHIIVISGQAVKSDMLKGLLAHELSHVYRTSSGHPSHNYELIADCIQNVTGELGLEEDQQDKLQQAVNHLQDLYADDIVFQVVRRKKIVPMETLGQFFLGWIQGTATDNAWENAAIMVRNSFAISNMQRHKIKDISGAKVNEKFLSQLPPAAAKEFTYFNKFMAGLKEDVTPEQYSKQLEEYLERFLAVVKRI